MPEFLHPTGRVAIGSTPLPASALRSCETCTFKAFPPVGGGDSPHNSSIRRSRETIAPACKRSTASSARSFAEPSGNSRSPSNTCNGPKMRNSTPLLYRVDHNR